MVFFLENNGELEHSVKYVSLFAGIEAASVAWEPLGWTPVAFSEIDPFASAVLANHWPDVPNHGDVTAFDWAKYRGKCDMVIGGSPCQSYSIAGLRKSLDDPRGQLTLAFVRACNDIDPGWILWENVPGCLSCAIDNPFGHFLAGVVGASEPLRPGLRNGRWPDAGMVIGPQRAACWSILDACRRGVPQRRRRLFCLAVSLSHFAGLAGKTPNPAAVLLESAGGFRSPSAGRAARKEARRPARSGPPGGGGLFPDLDQFDIAARPSIAKDDMLLPPVSGTLGGGSGTRGYPNSPDVTTFIPDVSPTVVGGAPFSRTGRRRVECDAFVPCVSAAVTAKWSKGCGGPAGDECQHLVPMENGGDIPEVAPTVVAGPPFSRTGNSRVECEAIIPDASPGGTPDDPYVIRLAQTSANGCGVDQGLAHTVDAGGPEAVVYPLLEVGKRTGPSNDRAHSGAGIGDNGDPMYTLQAGAKHGVAVSAPIAFHPTQDPIASVDVTHALGCGSSKGQASVAVAFSVKDSGGDAGEVAPTLRAMGHAASHANGGGQVAVVTVAGDVTHALRSEGADASEDGTGRGTPLVAISETPECSSLAIRGREGGLSAETLAGDAAHALRAAQGTLDKPHVLLPNVVRRLTPIEAERLQGFPDGHTLIPYGRNRRIKDLEEMADYWGVSRETAKTLAADSLRYKAVGNSMAIPCVWWIGRRIEWVLERLGISHHFKDGGSP